MKLDTFFEKIEHEKLKYNIAYKINAKRNLMFVIPTIFITSISSMLSFLSSSNLFPNEKDYIIMSVGILTSMASITQALSSALAFNVKAEMFRKAADSYDKLITRIEFEMESPNEDDFLNKLEGKILAIKEECKYLPPEIEGEKVVKKNNYQTLP
tara:strand:- start:250 stop:714 length:465 start_codon:yes stop_codon:yes gene_type:complete